MKAETTTNNHARNLVLLAGFMAGLADFLFASITRVMNGGSWMDPWKGVAGCLIGEAAREGGFEIVLLGRGDAVLHPEEGAVPAAAVAAGRRRVRHRVHARHELRGRAAVARGTVHLPGGDTAHQRVLAHRAGGDHFGVVRHASAEAGAR